MMKFFAVSGFLSCMLLSACVAVPPAQPLVQTPPIVALEDRTEPAVHDSEAAPIVESGSVIPERLLQSGIMDIGDRNAPLTLLVFTEYHCRYCKDFHDEYVTRLLTDFVEPGLLRLQFVPFPLRKYEHSGLAATAALCGAEQGKGMMMQTRIFDLVSKDRSTLIDAAGELGLDLELFTSCLDDAAAAVMQTQMSEWSRTLGVRYVPTFFLSGEKFVGLPEYAELRGRLEVALGEAKAAQATQ